MININLCMYVHRYIIIYIVFQKQPNPKIYEL